MKYFTLTVAIICLLSCREQVELMGECPALEAEKSSYSIHVYPIISKTCAIPQCHSGNFEYGDFNDFAQLKERVDDGKLLFMLERHQMPHGFTDGPEYLSTCDIEIIKKWLREGGANN